MVLAAIMGCGTAEAAERIRRANVSTKPVKGTYWWELEEALRRNGFRTRALGKPAQHYAAARMPGMRGPNIWIDHSFERRNPNAHWGTRAPLLPPMTTYLSRVSGKHGGCDNWDAPYTPVKLVGPTLAEWLRTTKRAPDTYYIVEVSHHWVLVKGRKFVDTFTKGEWVFLRSAPHRRKRVIGVWEVVPC
jgi:hypothetical protein